MTDFISSEAFHNHHEKIIHNEVIHNLYKISKEHTPCVPSAFAEEL